MDKICSIAIVIAIILAIVAAFIAIEPAAALLLILGGIGALNAGEKPEYRVRIYGAAIVLILGAHMLTAIPAIGAYLAAIFTGIGTMFVGMSVVAISLAVVAQLKANLVK